MKKNENGKYRCFITILKQLSINVPLVRSFRTNARLRQVYERSVTFEDDDRIHHCSAIATRSLVQKKEDPGAFTIPCTVGSLHFAEALCDLGEE